MPKDGYREAGSQRDALLMRATSAPLPAPDGKKGAEDQTVKARRGLVSCATGSVPPILASYTRSLRRLSVDGAYPRCQGFDEAPDGFGRTLSVDGADSRWHGRVALGGLRNGGPAAGNLLLNKFPQGSKDRVRAAAGPARRTIEELSRLAACNSPRRPSFVSSAKRRLPPTPGAGSSPTEPRPSSWEGNSEFDLRRTQSDAGGWEPGHAESPAALTPGAGSSPTNLSPTSTAGNFDFDFRRTRSDVPPSLRKLTHETLSLPKNWRMPTKRSEAAGDSACDFRRTRSDVPTPHAAPLNWHDTRLDVQREKKWLRDSLRRDSLTRDHGVLLGAAWALSLDHTCSDVLIM
jgi:hypothetical protein